jgi:hypothetical protein
MMRLIRFLFRRAAADAPPDRFELRLADLAAAGRLPAASPGALFGPLRTRRSRRAA